MISKRAVKEILGEIPLTAELYWHLRRTGRPVEPGFDLGRLQRNLPDWAAEARAAARNAPAGKRVLIFSTLRYWIEHTCLLGLALAGMGQRVTLAYLPYASWKAPVNRFDLRRQNAYARQALQAAEPLLEVVSLLEVNGSHNGLPGALEAQIQALAYRDAQYTLQMESVASDSELYRLRLERNRQAAQAGLTWLEGHRPEVVVIPNGSILEFGAVHHAARHLGLPTVTYEFGEQRQRVWLAQNDDVMRQDTGEMWQARGSRPLKEEEWERVRTLFAARQRADLWGNFARRWQDVPSAGGESTRAGLGLDGRPVVLLATNVIGDSLTLGRGTFTPSMSDWIVRTVAHFAGRPDAQLVVRIHPGEQITSGPSVADVVRSALPALPDHVHLVPADAQVNTYDLVEIADLGLVYTTTVGLEMVMSGVPVIVAGETHYRGKGFTLDPNSWPDYWSTLERALSDPPALRPSREQVESAWAYAYRFFFEYPRPFPWQLLHLKDELLEWPLARVLSPEGQACFGDTFRHLTGEPLDWGAIP
jgi:hypothetical protein